MAQLVDDFQFSQTSLQDYVDCRRRFYLRWIQQLAWPAAPAEPLEDVERHILAGQIFHRMVHQKIIGIPDALLERYLSVDESGNLETWWANIHPLLEDLEYSGAVLLPEVVLAGRLGSARLIAKLDLLAILPDGRLLIYDWKTSLKRPERTWMEKRLQTRIYPYMALRIETRGSRAPLSKFQGIEMVYWYANFPSQPERFAYSTELADEDDNYLRRLITEIQGLEKEDFHLTSKLTICRFCIYRSYCERGGRAGEWKSSEDMVEDLEMEPVDLDIEQIGEIPY